MLSAIDLNDQPTIVTTKIDNKPSN